MSSSTIHRHWDSGALIPSRLNLQIEKAQSLKERMPFLNKLFNCFFSCYTTILPFCDFETRLNLSHSCSRFFFIISRKDAWDDIINELHEKIADTDLDMRDALEIAQNNLRFVPHLKFIRIEKKHITDILALRRPDDDLKTLLRLLRSVLFDTKMEKWESYLKDTNMMKRDIVYQQMVELFDPEKVSPYNRRIIFKLVPNMDLHKMRRKSASCGEVIEWLIALHTYLKNKQDAGCFKTEKLYNIKLKLCRKLALIQKKLDYQWNFKLEDLSQIDSGLDLLNLESNTGMDPYTFTQNSTRNINNISNYSQNIENTEEVISDSDED